MRKSIIENRDVAWLDWNRLKPARNASTFATEPDLLTNVGIDDEEAPATTDDRVLHVVPEDDDSAAGRLEPRKAMLENENATAVIPSTEEDNAVENETENEDKKEARNYKAQRLENELKKLDTSCDPMSRPTRTIT
jgi:hypothetical protein